ncbi:MAG: uroporphyrinogen decarboxylase [Candidatus Micrarchaeota archaeon]|nr:uroporphyrinogen decarboxylase [Candidatus Micrarchaeota archaeon]
MNGRLLKACRRKKTDRTPIWIMRQAGRYLKDYRELRKTNTLMQLFEDPDKCSDVMSMPVERFGFDAAVLFADIMLPLKSIGVEFELVDSIGPVIKRPISGMHGIEELRATDVRDSVPYVFESIRLARKRLDVPTIGFCGGPFTVASYLIEGAPTREFRKTKSLMLRHPKEWSALMGVISDMSIEYMKQQALAGISAMQLFDSWAGCLTPAEYADNVHPHSKRILDSIPNGIPKIHFSAKSSGILAQLRAAGGDVIGIDSSAGIDDAWRHVGYDVGVQGNLDPKALLGQKESVVREAKLILDRAGGRPGHIFNLSHGILPETPEENVECLVEAVHSYGADR